MTETLVPIGDEIVLILIIVFFAIITIAGLIARITEYFENTEELKRLMYHADSEDEYRHWKRELLVRRLCVVPFVTPRIAKAFLRFFGKK